MSNSRNDGSTDDQREAIKRRYDLCDAACDTHIKTVSSWVDVGYPVEETRVEPEFGHGVETLLEDDSGNVISVETADGSTDGTYVAVYDVTLEDDPVQIMTNQDYEPVLAGDVL